MKNFGDKKLFSIEYEMDRSGEHNLGEAELRVCVNDKTICTYEREGRIYEFKWDVRDIVEWLEVNLGRIMKEKEGFPLPVEGNTVVELYQNSGNFDSEDEDEFDNWYGKRNDWFFDHSWLSSRAGGYLADLLFRKVDDTVEISWDNLKLYSEESIKFLNPVGVFYIEIDYLERVIRDFVETFKKDIQIGCV